MEMHERAAALARRLADGPPILIDGGTGTELERMGAAMHRTAWSALASLSDPDILRAVHGSFLKAGAEIIIANTYAANYHVMVASGLGDEFEAANREALRLALQARSETAERDVGRPVWVAGSMSTTTFSSGIDPDVVAKAGTTGKGYRAQAALIAEAGVDLIILEMMRDVTQTLRCLEAAGETGLPVWLGLSAERGPDGALVLFGSDVPFAQGVSQILEDTPPLQAVGVMHSQLELTPQALTTVSDLWKGAMFAYPHHGVFELPHWRFDNTLSPEEFAEAALGWVRSRVFAVGGCCGIRPAHIAALKERLQES